MGVDPSIDLAVLKSIRPRSTISPRSRSATPPRIPGGRSRRRHREPVRVHEDGDHRDRVRGRPRTRSRWSPSSCTRTGSRSRRRDRPPGDPRSRRAGARWMTSTSDGSIFRTARSLSCRRHHLGVDLLAALLERDGHRLGALDHVRVRHDRAVLGDHEAGARGRPAAVVGGRAGRSIPRPRRHRWRRRTPRRDPPLRSVANGPALAAVIRSGLCHG